MKNSATHFQYSWWKYLLIIMTSVVIWMVVFDGLSAPKKNEVIKITLIGDSFLCEELEDVLFGEITGLTDQPIKSISVENPINGESSDYHSVLTTRAYGADLIIVEESSMVENIGQGYFSKLPVEQLPDSIADAEHYTENGDIYGILLYDGSTPNVFSQFYTGKEKCYLFIAHTSVNAAGIMERGNAEDDAALRIIQYLLEGI